MPSQNLIEIKKVKEDPEARLRGLIKNSERKIRAAFLTAIANIKNQTTLNDIINYLESGNITEALKLADIIPSAIGSAISFSVIASGESAAILIGSMINNVTLFDFTSPRAVEIMQSSKLRLIREFSVEQTNATREALIEGIRNGDNPRVQAKAFRDSIGLTQKQVKAVENYKRLLQEGSSESLSRKLRDVRFDPTIRRSISTNTPLTSVQIDKMVNRYRERYISHRAEVIARTEALRAVHQGSEEMYQQAFDNGDLDPTQLIRKWVTAKDSRVRDSHNGMNGQLRQIGEPFVSDFGNLIRYPGDTTAPGSEVIQCRCVVTTRFL